MGYRVIPEAPDTDELLLREIENLVAQTRAAFDVQDWNQAAMQIGYASVQALRLAESLRPRVTAQVGGVGDFG